MRLLSNEEVDYEFGDSFGYNKKIVSELISEVVLNSGRFAEVDGSSVLICPAQMVCSSKNGLSTDFQFSKDFDFLTTVFVRGGSGKVKKRINIRRIGI